MRLIYVLVLMLLPILAFSQEEAFYIEFKDVDLNEAIGEIEDIYNVLFSYKDDYLIGKKVTFIRKKRTLEETLHELESISKLFYEVIYKRYIIVSL